MLPARSYYNAVIIVDIFQFSNAYAVLPDIADVAQYGEEDDEGVADLRSECENYVFNGSGEHPCLFCQLQRLTSSLQARQRLSRSPPFSLTTLGFDPA